MSDVTFTIEIDDKGTPILKNIKGAAADMGSGVERAGRGAGLAMDKVDSGFKKVLQSARSLTGILGITAGAAGMLAFTRSALNAADVIGDLSDQTGLSIGLLLAMRPALAGAGVSVEEFAQGVTMLQRNLVESTRGSNAQSEAMKRLGFTTQEALRLMADPQGFLEQFAKRLSTLPTQAERLAVAQDLASRSGGRLAAVFLKIAEEGLPQVSKETEEATAALSRYTDAIAVARTTTENFLIRVLGRLAIGIGFGSAVANLQTQLELLDRRIESLRERTTKTADLRARTVGEIELAGLLRDRADLEERLIALTARDVKTNIGPDPELIKRQETFTESLKKQAEALALQELEFSKGTRVMLEHKIMLLEDEAAQLKLGASGKKLVEQVRELTLGLFDANAELERQAKLSEVVEGIQDRATKRIAAELAENEARQKMHEDIKSAREAARSPIADLERQITVELTQESLKRVVIIGQEMDDRLEIVRRGLAQGVIEAQDAANLESRIRESALDKFRDQSETSVVALSNLAEGSINILSDLVNGSINSAEDFGRAALQILLRLTDQLTQMQLLFSLTGGKQGVDVFGSIGGLFGGGGAPDFGLDFGEGFHRGGIVEATRAAAPGLARYHAGGEVPIVAQSGEFIMRRQAVQTIGSSALTEMNRTGKTPEKPERPLVVSVQVNGSIIPNPGVPPDRVINIVIDELNQPVSRVRTAFRRY